MAIAFFYATGTIVGGFGGPLLFGALIQSGDPSQIFIGYVVGAAVMIVGGVIQATMGVEAAQRDLEDIAPPLSATRRGARGARRGGRPVHARPRRGPRHRERPALRRGAPEEAPAPPAGADRPTGGER